MTNKIKKNVAKRQDAIAIMDVCKAIAEMPDWAWPEEGPKLRDQIRAILDIKDGAEHDSGLITTLKG